MSHCIAFFLPWVLRAAYPLSEIDDHPERPWVEWARFAELGVDSRWAVRMIDEEVITERAIACQIGGLIERTQPTIDQFQQILPGVTGYDEREIHRILDWYRQWDR